MVESNNEQVERIDGATQTEELVPGKQGSSDTPATTAIVDHTLEKPIAPITPLKRVKMPPSRRKRNFGINPPMSDYSPMKRGKGGRTHQRMGRLKRPCSINRGARIIRPHYTSCRRQLPHPPYGLEPLQ